MRWLVAVALVAAGCRMLVPAPVLVREARPERLPLVIGVRYPDDFRSFVYRAPWDASVVVGRPSVKVFDEALAMLFARVVAMPGARAPATGDPGVAAVIEPRIVAVEMWYDTGRRETAGTPVSFAGTHAAITYRFTLDSTRGERLATWSVSGDGFLSANEGGLTPFEERALDLAIRDAAWSFVTGFRDVPEVRRWLDARRASPK
jgi:hypothetical protein